MAGHPDKSDDPKATDNFRKVSEAYEVLSDKDARARYDAGGSKAGGGVGGGFGRGGFGGGFKFRDAKDTFKDVFGTDDPFADFDKFFEDVEEEVVEETPSSRNAGRRGFGNLGNFPGGAAGGLGNLGSRFGSGGTGAPGSSFSISMSSSRRGRGGGF